MTSTNKRIFFVTCHLMTLSETKDAFFSSEGHFLHFFALDATSRDSFLSVDVKFRRSYFSFFICSELKQYFLKNLIFKTFLSFFFRPVNFEGYVIPKNAHVIPLLHAVHMNPDYWEEPEAFKPERFLSEDRKTIQKPEHFMPFGVGQRMCLGDHLAEKEFFLFFSSLLHVFDIQNPSGSPLPGLRGVAGVTVTPTDFEVICLPRHVQPRTSG